MQQHPDLTALHLDIAQAMDAALAHVRRSLGPSAWYSVELRVGADGYNIETVHYVGYRGKDPGSIQVWGRGANVDAAIDEALEEMPARRPRAWVREG